MKGSLKGLTRRRILVGGGVALAGVYARMLPAFAPAFAYDTPILTRTIPSTGEQVPAVGMGSWITFNVGANETLRAARAEVLRAFFEAGGALVDSSPMYGSSEEVIGWCLEHLGHPPRLFSATKVWTLTQFMGRRQMTASEEQWRSGGLDLIQIHNLVDWEAHLETLREWKGEGRIRYLGATTSHGRRHSEMIEVMRGNDLDTVQFTYNILDREAESRLLPLAADRGMAVIVNRPFRRGKLFEHVAGHPLPEWAYEIDCANWAQFFLKFILSHPTVTCAIPATSKVAHMRENMGAAYGRMPDRDLRARMVNCVEGL